MAGTEVGSLYYDLNIDDSNLKKQLNDADKSVKSFGDRVSQSWENSVDASRKFGLAVAAVGAGIVAFGVSSVKAFEDSQNRIAQTEAVIKSTGQAAGVTAQAVTDLATALEKQTRFSDEDVRSVENLLLTFTSIGKDIFPQATKTVLDMATALGEDTKSAAIQLGKALQDPVLGVTALRRVGVNFNSAQQDVIKNLVDTGQSAKAQQLIMAELTKEFGGSAEAAGNTLAGSLDKLKNQFDNVQEALGGLIAQVAAPFLTALMNWFNAAGGVDGIMKKLKKDFEELKPWLPAIAGLIIGGLTPAFLALAGSIALVMIRLAPFMAAGALLAYLWEKNKLLFSIVAGAIAGLAAVLLSTMVPALIATATAAWAAIVPLLPFIALGVVIGAVIGGAAYLIVKHWTAVKNFFIGLWDWVKTNWPYLVAVLTGGLGIAVLVIIKNWEPIKNFFVGIWQAVRDAFVTAWQAIYNVVSTVMNAIWAVVSPILNFLKDLFIIVFGGILLVVLTILTAVKDFWIGVFTEIWNFIQPILSAIWGAISWLLNTVWQGWVNIFSMVRDFAVGVWNTIYGVITGVVSSIINFFAPAFSWLYDKGKAIINGLTQGIKDVAGTVWGAIKLAADKIGEFFAGAAGWLYGVGKAIVQGLVNGIKDMVHAVSDAAGNIADAVKNKVKNLLGIHSPSKVFQDIGMNVTQGFVDGVTNSIGLAEKAMNGFSNAVMAPTVDINASGATPAGQNAAPVTKMGDTVVNIGQINNQQDEDWVLRRMDRNQQLATMGLSTR